MRGDKPEWFAVEWTTADGLPVRIWAQKGPIPAAPAGLVWSFKWLPGSAVNMRTAQRIAAARLRQVLDWSKQAKSSKSSQSHQPPQP